MTIDKTILKQLEDTYRKHFPNDLKQYLLVKYGQEPFPYEFSEQDLYTNIDRDIQAYEAGKLDVTAKSPAERWQEEREYLQSLYVKRSCEVRELSDYVAKLERRLAENGLETPRMVRKLVDSSKAPSF